MSSHFGPDTTLNRCWHCDFNNPSTTTTCMQQGCGAQHTPTRQPPATALNYQSISFGQRADDLPCHRLHASLLDEAVQAFQYRTLYAVRVGLRVGEEHNVAIMIKDTNGAIRRTVWIPSISGCAPWAGDSFTEFLHVAQMILLAEPNPNIGKLTLPP